METCKYQTVSNLATINKNIFYEKILLFDAIPIA